MNYKFLEKIEIINGKVYTKSHFSSTTHLTAPIQSPHTLCEDPILTSILQSAGEHAVFKKLGEDVFEGTVIVRPYNCLLAEYIKKAGELIKAPLKYSLDRDHAGEFIATVVEGYMRDVCYSPLPELKQLTLLRSDPDVVFSICRNNPVAFHFSDDTVRRNRDFARRYILEFAHIDGFSLPTYFRNDKAIALEALQRNASLFRHLDLSLRNDMDVVRIAYTPTTCRKESDFYLSYIGNSLRSNAVFMRELVRECPSLRFDDCMDVLVLPGVAETWALYNLWVRRDLLFAPSEILTKPEVRNTLMARLAEDPSSITFLNMLTDQKCSSFMVVEPHCITANLPSRRSFNRVKL